MNVKVSFIELRPGEQHPMCWNLLAINEVCDEFGSLDEMQKIVDEKDIGKSAGAIGKLLRCLLDGGRAYYEEMDMPLPKRVKVPEALIDIRDPETIRTIFGVMQSDKKTEIEVVSKNVEATPGN